METAARWNRTWEYFDSQAPIGLLDKITAAYAEPHRAYHTAQHLSECFGFLDDCLVEPSDAGLLELSLWFHDAIYDTRSSDNEAQSAAWARSSLPDLPPDDLDKIERFILVTKHDAAPASPDEKLLLDIDLSILGSRRKRFLEYEAQIRREYAWVPEDAYRAARSKIMSQFHDRRIIYHTPGFRDELESRARENIEFSLESLGRQHDDDDPRGIAG